MQNSKYARAVQVVHIKRLNYHEKVPEMGEHCKQNISYYN